MKKVLITGANGFIGKYCIELLKNLDYEIHAIDKKITSDQKESDIFWYQVDLLERDEIFNIIEHVKPTHLLHMAWYTSNNGYDETIHYEWVKVGIDIIVAFTKFGGKRILGIGTCAEYDWGHSFMSEDSTPLHSDSAYGASKHALHIVSDQFCQQQNLSYAWARIFFVYGPKENKNRLLPYTINSILKGKEVLITNIEKLRDYLHVEDVAQAIVSILDSDIQGSINICSGKPIRIKEIVNYIGKKLNGEHLIKDKSMPSSQRDPFCIIGNNRRLTEEVGWKETINLEDGLNDIIKQELQSK